MSKRVQVYIEMDGKRINAFTGTLRAGVPWMFWHRIVPDTEYIDLPPIFCIEEIKEES
jgi:hypothetical protein